MADRVRERRKKHIDRGSLIDRVMDMQESEQADPLLDDEQIAYIGAFGSSRCISVR